MKIKPYNLTLKQRVERQIYQFKKYCYLSISSAFLMFFLFYALTSLAGIHYILSFIIAYVIWVTYSFILSRRYIYIVFNPKSITRLYYEFVIVSLIGLVLNSMALYLLVDFFGIYYLLSQAIIAVMGAPFLFLAYKKFVFSHR